MNELIHISSFSLFILCCLAGYTVFLLGRILWALGLLVYHVTSLTLWNVRTAPRARASFRVGFLAVARDRGWRYATCRLAAIWWEGLQVVVNSTKVSYGAAYWSSPDDWRLGVGNSRMTPKAKKNLLHKPDQS